MRLPFHGTFSKAELLLLKRIHLFAREVGNRSWSLYVEFEMVFNPTLLQILQTI